MTACKTCCGTGIVSHTENGAPHGAGYWPMEVTDPCPDCVSLELCPKCLTPRGPWLYMACGDVYMVIGQAGDKLYRWLEHQRLYPDRNHPKYFKYSENSWAWGVATCPWPGNIRRKLVYRLNRMLVRLSCWPLTFQNWVYKNMELPTKCMACGERIDQE